MSVALARPLFLALQENFDALPDPRVARTRLHRLSDLLLLSLAAFCCGANGFEDIQLWCLAQGVDALRALLGVRLDNGIPHHDTFRRVLARLEPAGLEQSLNTLRARVPVGEPEAKPAGRHLALDGKVLRGSQDARRATEPLGLLSVLATDLNLVLGQAKVSGTTSEIPVARDVLRTIDLIDIAGATVTADALHCQSQTARVIRERGADYLLAVKDNQKGLHNALKGLFHRNLKEARLPMQTAQQEETGHGRREKRTGWLIRADDWLPQDDPLFAWPGLQSVLCLEGERTWTERGHKKHSLCTRYFISSSTADVARLMGLVRSHWGIENKLHWILDVTFAEDASWVRSGHEAENLATVRRLAASLLQAAQPDEPEAIQNMSLAKRRKWAGWKNTYLHKVLTN